VPVEELEGWRVGVLKVKKGEGGERFQSHCGSALRYYAVVNYAGTPYLYFYLI
jgi:hypothetical protein